MAWAIILANSADSTGKPSLATAKLVIENEAGLQQQFFEVVGRIKNDGNIGTVQAMLLTSKGDWEEQKVPVGSDGLVPAGEAKQVSCHRTGRC